MLKTSNALHNATRWAQKTFKVTAKLIKN